MSLMKKLKDAGDKAGKAVAAEYQKQQQKVEERKAVQAQAAADEQARQQSILAGNIAPIAVTVALQPGETAYLQLNAKRMAQVESVVQTTVGKSKKKGVVGRAIVGGVLLGPLGAVGGAATAGSRNKSTTVSQTVSRLQVVDNGTLIFTNRRFLFIGQNNVFALPYSELIAVEFSGKRASLKYNGMLNGEYYELIGFAATELQLYYSGITQNLLA